MQGVGALLLGGSLSPLSTLVVPADRHSGRGTSAAGVATAPSITDVDATDAPCEALGVEEGGGGAGKGGNVCASFIATGRVYPFSTIQLIRSCISGLTGNWSGPGTGMSAGNECMASPTITVVGTPCCPEPDAPVLAVTGCVSAVGTGAFCDVTPGPCTVTGGYPRMSAKRPPG